MIHGPREVLEPFTLTKMRRDQQTIPLRPPLSLQAGDQVLPLEGALIAYRDGHTLATYLLTGNELTRHWARSEEK